MTKKKNRITEKRENQESTIEWYQLIYETDDNVNVIYCDLIL